MFRQFFWLSLILLLAPSGSALAQISPVPYSDLLRQLDGRMSFETLPRQPEPGFVLDQPLRVVGGWIGERFEGQDVTGATHDQLATLPNAPLRVISGQPGRNLSIAYHRGFGSNAVFPLGPTGFPALDARGEGAMSVLFDRDQAEFGLRIHSDYADPLGARQRAGHVTLRMFDRKGQVIAEVTLPLTTGILEIGLRRDGNVPDIAGIAITNTDPGGIAIDDILFQRTARIG